MRTLSYRLLVNRDAQTQRDTLNLLDQRNAQMDRAREAYVPMIRADDEQAAFDQLSQYRQLESRMRTLSQENRLDELSDMLNRDLMANSEQMNKVMDTLLPGAALRPIATQGRSYKGPRSPVGAALCRDGLRIAPRFRISNRSAHPLSARCSTTGCSLRLRPLR